MEWKELTIAVLTNDEILKKQKMLAQIGNDDLIENITKGNIEFDLLIATLI
jgi:ribosomal protein L1